MVKFSFPSLPALLLGALALLILPVPLPAWGQAPDTGRVNGRILGAEPGQDLSDAKVVLIRFLLDAKGTPQGETVATQSLSPEGVFAFSEVKVEKGAVYQVGAKMGDRVAGSKLFAFPEGKREVMLDIHWQEPGVGTAGVKIQEGLVAVEPQTGAVWVTEVVHLINPAGVAIKSKVPLELTIPRAAERLEMMRGIETGGKHEQLGSRLLVYGTLPPGRTTVAFRYRLAAPLGSVALEKRYPHPVGVLSVLTPKEALTFQGEGFTSRKSQRIDGKPFDVWAMEGIEAGATVRVRLGGVPMRKEWYLAALGFFLLLSGGVVIWFIRARLPREVSTGAA